MFSLSWERMYEIFYGSDKDYQVQREAEGWEIFECTAALVGPDGKEHEARVCAERRFLDDGHIEIVNRFVAKWLD